MGGIISDITGVAGDNTPTYKNAVRAATTGNITGTYNSTAKTLTSLSNGALPAQDGITLVAGESLLLKNQSTGSQNGTYVVTQVGDGSSPYILTRRDDLNSDNKLETNLVVPVSEGATLEDTNWQLTTDEPLTLDTTSLVFAQFGSGIPTLAQVLGVGNATGGNDIVLTSGDFITSSSGSSQIDLRYSGVDSTIAITTDAGAYGAEVMALDVAYAELSTYRTGGNTYLSVATANISLLDSGGTTGSITLTASGATASLNYTSAFLHSHKIGAVEIFKAQDVNTGALTTSWTESATTERGVVINSNGATINIGVARSVIIGGDSITASKNNTLYVDEFNIKTLYTGIANKVLAVDASGNVVDGAGLLAAADAWDEVLGNNNETGANDTIWSKTGTATSTATQAGSQKIQLQNSLWDGASESVTTWDLESIASVTTNERATLSLKYNGGVDILRIQNNGSVSFGAGTPDVTQLGTYFFDKTFHDQELVVDLDAHISFRGAITGTEQAYISGFSGAGRKISIYTKDSGGSRLHAISWDEDQNTLIGTTSNLSAKLTVRGADSGSINYTARMINFSSAELFNVRNDGSIGIGSVTAPAGMTTGFYVASGTAPSSDVADQFSFYSADIVAGNAAAHFRTENGQIIKLYQASSGWTITNLTTDRVYDANSTTLDEIADVLGTLIEDLKLTGLIG